MHRSLHRQPPPRPRLAPYPADSVLPFRLARTNPGRYGRTLSAALGHDVPVSESTSPAGPALVYVARPTQPSVGGILAAMRELAGLGLHLATTTAVAVIAPPLTALLDRLVPLVANAIIQRLDLTAIVLRQVDLEAIVRETLNRIDINEIVDRLPIVEIADYVIEEIDLPQLIRQSTGGVAIDAMDSLRLQSYAADERVTRVTDRLFPWRRT